jgi:hypothetical protein
MNPMQSLVRLWLLLCIVSLFAIQGQAQAPPAKGMDSILGNWVFVAKTPVVRAEGTLVVLQIEAAYVLQGPYEEGVVSEAELKAGGQYPLLHFGFQSEEGGAETLRTYRGEWLEEEGLLRLEVDGTVAYYAPMSYQEKAALFQLDPQYGTPALEPQFERAAP